MGYFFLVVGLLDAPGALDTLAEGFAEGADAEAERVEDGADRNKKRLDIEETPISEMSEEDKEALIREMEAQAERGNRRFSADTARAVLDMCDSKFKDVNLENLFTKLVWEPDFILTSMEEGYKIPKEFRPATMAPRVAKLAQVWTELCRYVAAILKIGGEFGVGFVFGDDIKALYQRLNGDDWLLLNPYKNWSQKTLWTPTNEADLSWLYAAAIHECTHYQITVQGGRGGHNEDFAIAYTNNVGLCAKGWRKVKQIERGAKMTKKVRKESFKNDSDKDRKWRV